MNTQILENPPPLRSIGNGITNQIKAKRTSNLILPNSGSIQIEILHNCPAKKSETDFIEGKICRKYSGLGLAILSSFVFSLTALLVKHFDNHNPISISLWRFQGALWPSIPLFICHKLFDGESSSTSLTVKDNSGIPEINKFKLYALLWTRSILSCNAFVLNFYSLKYLEMGDALAIASSTPVFVTLFAHYFLGEQCGLVQGAAAVLTVFGVIVIARPPHLTGEEAFDFNTLVGTALALGCMLLGTLSFVVLRYLRRIHYSEIVLAFGVWGTFENLVLAIFFGVLTLPSGQQECTLVALLVVLSFLGQLTIIFALKRELAGPVALVRTFDVIFAFGWQILFLGRIPDLYSLVGALIIIFGIVLTTLRKWVSSLPANHASRKRFRILLI